MVKRILGIVGAIIIILAIYVVYSVFKPPAEASAPVTAIPITLEATTAAPTGAEPAATGSETATSTPEGSVTATNGEVIYQIVSADSQASFTVDEVLNGSPNTVVGTTNQVAGQIAFDANNPAGAQIGTIQVDARTLTTDSNMRNRMIANRILNTNNYEYITFTPKKLSGLPDRVTFGTSYTFQITGDLTIQDVTKEVTFDANVTPVDATHIKGTATTTISRQDFSLSIPQVPSVASVDDTVTLEVSFVAASQ
jgi:polyisoprenoid-binding protein YceI